MPRWLEGGAGPLNAGQPGVANGGPPRAANGGGPPHLADATRPWAARATPLRAGRRTDAEAPARAAGWLAAGRARGGALDRRCAVALHRAAAYPFALRLLQACSRLADGPLWVSLLLLLPLTGVAGLHWALLVLVTGSVNLLIYWAVKRGTRRPRPFRQHPGLIRARARAPDLFSFPSGHTVHAVAFALLLSAAYPALAPLLWGFAALVGASRVVLGLHYPSDVLAGAVIGAVTASLVIAGFGPATA